MKSAIAQNSFTKIQDCAHPHLIPLDFEERLAEVRGFVSYVHKDWMLYYTIKNALYLASMVPQRIDENIIKAGKMIIKKDARVLLDVLTVPSKPSAVSRPTPN